MPNEGVFVNKKVSVEDAKRIVAYHTGEIISAIGHQGTADAFNALKFPVAVEVNRIHAKMERGSEAVCLKINGRLPEGEILTLEKMEEIGYEFFHVVNLGENGLQHAYMLGMGDVAGYSNQRPNLETAILQGFPA